MKAFGAGTRAVKTDPSKSKDNGSGKNDKWLTGISDQLSEQERVKEREELEDYRVVPRNLIDINETNARELSINPEWLTKNQDLIVFGEDVNLEDDAWFDAYVEKLTASIADKDILEDCLDIARFAREVGKPENIMHAIVVYVDDGRLKIISGERRFLCHFFWGAMLVGVKVWRERPTQLQFKILERQENNLRSDLTSYEKFLSDSAVYEAWMAEDSKRKGQVREFASVIRVEKSQAAKVIKLIDCRSSGEDYGLFDCFKNGVIGIEAAYLLATLDKKTRKELMGEIKGRAKVSLRDIEKMLVTEKKQKPAKKVSPVKLVRSGNQDAVVFIVNEMVEKLGDETLKGQIKEMDLKKFKDISSAMELLLKYIEENKV